jgi:hypothetical protein
MSVSPLPVRRSDMDFYEALKQINDGKCVTKLEWNDEGVYALLHNGHLVIHHNQSQLCPNPCTDHPYHTWILRDADMAGEDYVIVEPEPEVVQ